MTTLEDVTAGYRKWMHLPDPEVLYVNLAAVAANHLQGDPVWLMNVGPPGSGKTETLNGISKLPNTYLVATVTEAALLSGTPKKDTAAGSKGGLLREVGDFGILILKDFTSILSMNRDARANVLAALREIYDGSWTRLIGTDGGRALHWEGKIGVIAGCTPIIDSHHAVISSLGERFTFYRLPKVDGDAQAERAMANFGKEQQMRAELADITTRFFAERHGINLPMRDLYDTEQKRIIDLANIGVRCRSAIERDNHTREILLIPQPEAPGRMAGVLRRMLAGLDVIGVDAETTWRILSKLALDSMPALRRASIDHLLTGQPGEPFTTSQIAEAIEHPTNTTRRALEDLTGFGIVTRHPGGNGNPDRWQLSKWSRSRWPTGGVPEMSNPSYYSELMNNNKTGTVQAEAAS